MEKGIEKGLREGLLQGIELGLELKFGAEGLKLMPGINNLENIETLRVFHRAIKTAKSVAELPQVGT